MEQLAILNFQTISGKSLKKKSKHIGLILIIF